METFLLLLCIVVLLVGPFAALALIWGRPIRNSDSFWGAVMATMGVTVLWIFLLAQVIVLV